MLDQRAREIEAFKERGIPLPEWAESALQPTNNTEAK